MRLLSAVFICCTVIASAAGPPTAPEPCNKTEIGFVDSLTGPWHDQTYQNRLLVKTLPLCSDSRLVRLKEAEYSAKDYLQVNSVMGDLMRFDCAQPLVCDDAIQFTDINKKLMAKLKPMSPLASLTYSFSHPRDHGTPTISRGESTQSATDPKLNNVVMGAGVQLKASLVFAAAQTGKIYHFDLCLNAEKQDCGKSLPQAREYRFDDPYLPFGNVPPGLHVLYEAHTLPNDTVYFRTENRVFILAADPSWTAEDLEFVRTTLTLTLMDPDMTHDQLDGQLAALGATLSLPRR
jgi:hypothetical protein